MIHYTTQNRSFVTIHYILKQMGIKNNTFMLQLYDKDLIDVDPMREDLPIEMQVKIHYEISRNIWYFFREIVRIPANENKLNFEVNRGNLAIIWAFMLNLDFSVLLPRQSYKSYTIDACYCWLVYWGSKNFDAVFFGHMSEIPLQNLERVKFVRDNLPEYLKLNVSRRDKDNKTYLTYEPGSFSNKIRTMAPGYSEDRADKIGRGASTREQFYDEVAFIPYVDIQYSSAIYAYMTVAKVAERTNESHHIIMTTTAGSKLTPQGRWAYDLFYQSARFNENLFDLVTHDRYGNVNFDRDQILEYIATNSRKIKMLHIEFMYYDLSKGDAYLEDMRSKSTSEQKFRREVLNEWDDDVEDHPLGNETLAVVRESQKSPVSTIVVDRVFFVNVFKSVDWIRRNSDRLAIGIDCSPNVGSDFSTFVASDIRNGETVATMRTNAYEILRFATALIVIIKQYFPKSVVIVERNHVGYAILSMLESRLPPNRIYHDVDGKPGVYMTAHLRNDIFYGSVFKSASEQFGKYIYDEYIINEIVDLVINDKGRVDHKKGKHDDMVFAWLYTRWFCSGFCKNKSQYFRATLFNSELDGMVDESKSVSYEQESVFSMMKKEEDKMFNVYSSPTDIDGKFYGLQTHVNKLKQMDERQLKNVSSTEFDSSYNMPELTGNPDHDSYKKIEKEVEKLSVKKDVDNIKTPVNNIDVKKYLKYMSER